MDQQITAVIVNRQEHKLRVMMFKQEWCDSPKQQTYLITRQCIGDLSRFWLSCIGILVLFLPDLSRFWLSCINPLILLLPDLSWFWLSCIGPLVLLLPDLSRFWPSCIGPLDLLLPKFKLFGFPIFRFWPCLMKVITGTRTKFYIYVFIIKKSLKIPKG